MSKFNVAWKNGISETELQRNRESWSSSRERLVVAWFPQSVATVAKTWIPHSRVKRRETMSDNIRVVQKPGSIAEFEVVCIWVSWLVAGRRERPSSPRAFVLPFRNLPPLQRQ